MKLLNNIKSGILRAVKKFNGWRDLPKPDNNAECHNIQEQLSEEEEKDLEAEIGNVLLYSGYQPGSTEWKSAMNRWKRVRITDPRLFQKFMNLD